MSWTKDEIRELKYLHSLDKYFWKEIAERLGKRPASVSWQAKRLGFKHGPNVSARKGKWNVKHKHLREAVMKYFMTHSIKETMKHFDLTHSEVKSIFTIGYRDPKFKHLRKETRRHDSWSNEETLFLLRHAGLQSRNWISRKLKRGGVHAVKESLCRLNSNSKYVNGMPRRWAEVLLGSDGLPEGIKTKAGPTGNSRNIDFRFRIIPWVEAESLIKGKKVDSQLRLAIKAMARFQRFIHKSKSDKQIVKTLKAIAEAR